ncbi:MAG: glutathione S-transferase family protein [Deltaproteobacteria bacterium]|nr:glutathione S-transferase family protein [Deltaproteobacteria bacterium]
MIKNYILTGHGDLVSLSPFCVKTDIYLRMRELPYKNVYGDPRRAPKGKLPTIDDEGDQLADSQLIIEHLERKYPEPLDAGLDAKTLARHHLLRRTLEEGLYFCAVYARWVDPTAWPAFRALILPTLPKGIGRFILPLIRRKIGKDLWAQGTGRHSASEIYAMACADIDAMASALGDAPYFGGQEPRTIDAATFAFIANALLVDLPSKLADRIREHENLVGYCDRVHERFYSRG